MATYLITGDGLVTCPYDPVHKVLASRLQNHMAKCKTNHLDMDVKTCLFNAQHVVPSKELNHHLSNCPDRLCLDKELAAKFYEPPNAKGRTAVPSYNSPILTGGENWDDEIDPSGASGYIPKPPTLTTGLIQDLEMMKPAERKKVYRQRPDELEARPSPVPPRPTNVPSRQPKLSHEHAREMPQPTLNRGGGIGRGQPIVSGQRQQPSPYNQVVPSKMCIGRGNVDKALYEQNFPSLGQ